MSVLKVGMYASQFPVGYGDPYWDDVLALIRCDGELVDLKGNCTLVADVGYKRFTEGDSHLAAYANPVVRCYMSFLLTEPLKTSEDWTIEYTITPEEKTESQTSLFPHYLGISSGGSRCIAVYGNSAHNYVHRVQVNMKDGSRSNISDDLPWIKGVSHKISLTHANGRILAHVDGKMWSNRIAYPFRFDFLDRLYIFAIDGAGDSTGLGTIEEIRVTQKARYSAANYYIDEPVFQQDKLPIPVYPKDPLYSDVVSLLRVQQGFLYDTKLSELTPQTTSSTVTGYYLDALKFTNASHKRVVTLTEPLAGDFTFEFTFSLDAINESLPFEYLLRLMDGGSPQQPVVDILRYDDEPNKLVLTGFVSESIEVTGSFNRFSITKTGTSLKCYLNGELKTTTTLPSSNPISEIHLSSDTNPFSGTLEELRLTKGIRYAGNYTPSEEVFPTRTAI